MQLISKPFIFMRHGETTANQNNLFCGITDLPLNTTGRQQAIDARQYMTTLETSRMTIISSPMRRAVETTQLVLPNVNFKTYPDLSERDWGELEIQPITQPICYQETPPDGESWDNFIDRVTVALNQILTEHDNPLIVAHSGIYRAIQYHLTGSPTGARIPNATPVRFWLERKEWKQQIIEEKTK